MMVVLVMSIWPEVYVLIHVIHLVLPKTAHLQQHFITTIGWGLLHGVSITKNGFITIGIGVGIQDVVTLEIRDLTSLMLPDGDSVKKNILFQSILQVVYMVLTQKSVNRKLQIHKPLYLNMEMGKFLSLKPGADILIQNQVLVFRSEIYFTALKDTSSLKVNQPGHGKLFVNGKKCLLQVQKKIKMCKMNGMMILLAHLVQLLDHTGEIWSMQYALEKTRT